MFNEIGEARECPECHASISENDNYCPACGADVRMVMAQPSKDHQSTKVADDQVSDTQDFSSDISPATVVRLKKKANAQESPTETGDATDADSKTTRKATPQAETPKPRRAPRRRTHSNGAIELSYGNDSQQPTAPSKEKEEEEIIGDDCGYTDAPVFVDENEPKLEEEIKLDPKDHSSNAWSSYVFVGIASLLLGALLYYAI